MSWTQNSFDRRLGFEDDNFMEMSFSQTVILYIMDQIKKIKSWTRQSFKRGNQIGYDAKKPIKY